MTNWDKFLINTGEIYEHEYLNWKQDSGVRQMISQMESHILNQLRKNNLVFASSSTHSHDEYMDMLHQFKGTQNRVRVEKLSPFTRYWVLEGSNWEVFDYSTEFNMSKDDVDPEIFGFFFAFKLRQVDFLQIDSFLSFHMNQSFGNDKRSYFRYLTILLRMYQVLYDDSRIETIDEWMEKGYWLTEDQIANISDSEKIKWNGTQKNLAELFIELQTKGWIDEIDPDKIKRAFTKSKSIQQPLIKTFSRDLKKHIYYEIEAESYRNKFHNILSRKKPINK